MSLWAFIHSPEPTFSGGFAQCGEFRQRSKKARRASEQTRICMLPGTVGEPRRGRWRHGFMIVLNVRNAIRCHGSRLSS
jgi:hypothetical protein